MQFILASQYLIADLDTFIHLGTGTVGIRGLPAGVGEMRVGLRKGPWKRESAVSLPQSLSASAA